MRWAESVMIALRQGTQRRRNEAAELHPDLTTPCPQLVVEGAGIVTLEPLADNRDELRPQARQARPTNIAPR